MDTILVSSDNKRDTNILLKLIKKMGLKSKLITEDEKEDYSLLKAMLEADRNEFEYESVINNKLKGKCN